MKLAFLASVATICLFVLARVAETLFREAKELLPERLHKHLEAFAPSPKETA
jgi:hypothetical protein